jgi:uncharacterized membrane protein
MTKDSQGGIGRHIRTSVMRGLLFMVPIAVTIFVVTFLAGIAGGWLGPLAAALWGAIGLGSWLSGPFAGHLIAGLSLILFIALLYLVGQVASLEVGRRGLRLIDHLFQAIPGVRVIYSAARKVVDALGDSAKPKFQRAVLINWGPNGTKTMGFVTGETIDATTGCKHLVVFIPTPPNPASGFITFVPEDEATDPGFSMDEALKIAMSLGVLAPDRMVITTPGAGHCSGRTSGKVEPKS